MAKIQHGSMIFKDSQGNIINVNGLSQNDIQKVKDGLTKITALEKAIASINSGQRMIALKDYYTDDTHKDEMAVGVYYSVPFNKQDQYLEIDPATMLVKNPQTNNAVTDLEVAYVRICVKASDGTVDKNGKIDIKVSFDNVAMEDKANTFTADNTFEKDITVNATQDVSTLGDNKLTTAKWVRDNIKKSVTDAAHLTAEYQATAPSDDTLTANKLVFFDAVDAI